jgi:uncharacterized membrane protein (UPF0182 family)
MRLLTLPKDSQVSGPGQVQNEIGSSNATSPDSALNLSQFLNNARQSGSRVTLGNLLTLPVGGGLLYVQPIYVRAQGESAFPLQRATVVAFGDKLAWAYTLDGALDGLFGGNSGASAGDSGSTPPTTGGGTPTTPPADAAALTKALADIQAAYAAGQKALKAGDFAAYGTAQKDLNDAIQRAVAAAPKGGSVKATVDAYDGSVKLYAWDEKDPLLKAWSKAFDNTVLPMSDMSADLMSHIRYPEDLFKVQRQMLAKYHVTDAASFYGGQDYWQIPEDPAQEASVVQPPYYLTLKMPDQNDARFSITTTFKPVGDRQILTGFLAVDADAGSTKGQRSSDYGTMRLLTLPKDSQVSGPGQVQNEIGSSNATSPDSALNLSQFLNNARQSGSSVTLGNLLTLPVGGGLLYVQPIYVRAQGDSAFPLQRATVVAFGDKLAWAYTLDGALDGLFGGNSGATAGDSGSTPTPTTPGGTPTTPGGTPTTPAPTDAAALAKALADIQAAYDAGQKALKAGDFAAYGTAQKQLNEAIPRAVAAAPTGGSVTVTPAPSATATPTPTATSTP